MIDYGKLNNIKYSVGKTLTIEDYELLYKRFCDFGYYIEASALKLSGMIRDAAGANSDYEEGYLKALEDFALLMCEMYDEFIGGKNDDKQ